jgi:hypothetical protein
LAEERASVEEAGDETGPEWISGRGLEKAAEARKTELQRKRDGFSGEVSADGKPITIDTNPQILSAAEEQELSELEAAMPDGGEPDLETLAGLYGKKIKSVKEGKSEVAETPKTDVSTTPATPADLEKTKAAEKALTEAGFTADVLTWTEEDFADNKFPPVLARKVRAIREAQGFPIESRTEAPATETPETREEISARLRKEVEKSDEMDARRQKVDRAVKEAEILDDILNLDPDDNATLLLSNKEKKARLSPDQVEEFARRTAPSFSDLSLTAETQAPTPEATKEGTAPVTRLTPKEATALEDAAYQEASDWDRANRSGRMDEWFLGGKADVDATRGYNEAMAAGAEGLQAHGMAKESTLSGGLRNLAGLLRDGLDPNRRGGRLDTAPLVAKPGEGLVGATASGAAYSEGPFTLVARPGESLTGDLSGLGAVIINQANAGQAEAIKKALQAIRPDLIVGTASEAGVIAKQLLGGQQAASAAKPTTEATKEGTPEAPDSAQTVEGQGDEKDTTGVTEGVDAGDDVATIKQDEPSTDKGDTGERSTGAAQGDRQQASSDAQRALLGSESKPSEGVGQREVDAREGAARTLQAGGGDGTKLGRGNMGDQGGGGLGADRDVGGTVQEARQARKQVRDEALETAKGAWEDILNAGKGELPYRSGGGKYLVSQSAKPGVMLQITRTNAEGDPIGDEEIRTEEDFNRVLADQEYIDAALLRVRPDVGQAVGMASSIPKAEVPYHYQYRLRLRDVAPGTAPKGFISSSGRDVTYDRPLTKQELYDFEMEPVGAVKAPAPKESLPTDTPAPEEGAGGVRKAGVAQWFPATKVLPSDQRDELNLQRKLGDLFALKDRLGELKTEKAKSKLLRDNGGWKSEAEIDAAVDFHRGLLKDLGVTVAPEPPPSAPDSETSQETPTTSFPDKSGAMRTIKFPNDLSSWERGKKWAKDNLKTWSGTVGFAKDVSPEFDKAESMRQRATGKIKDLLFGKTSASRPSRDLQFWVGVHDAAQQVTKAESDKKAAPTPESPPPSSQETGAATSPQGATAPAIEDYLAIEDLTEGARYAAEQTKAKAERTGSRQYLVTRVDGYHIVEDAGSDRVLAVAEPTSESPPPASPETDATSVKAEMRSVLEKQAEEAGVEVTPEMTDFEIIDALDAADAGPPIWEYSIKALQDTFDLTEEQAVVVYAIGQAMGARVDGLVRGGVPGDAALRQFAGEKANVPQFMRDSLDTAKAMAAAGKSSEEIRAVTGWFPGKYDGKMRWEIPDGGAELKPVNLVKGEVGAYGKDALQAESGTVLSEVMDHPELFKAYPDARNIRIQFQVGEWVRNSGKWGGTFRATSDGAGFIEVLLPSEELTRDESTRGIILHEVQHWIQRVEETPIGASPQGRSLFGQEAKIAGLEEEGKVLWGLVELARKGEELSGRYDVGGLPRIAEQIRGVFPEMDPRSIEWWLSGNRRRLKYPVTEEDAQRAFSEQEEELMREVERDTGDEYNRTAGEIEARDVQARAKLTPEQLKATEPYSSENISAEDAIVLFQGTKKPKGAMEQNVETGKIFLRGLESPDFTTGVHELSHVGRRTGRHLLTPEELKTAETWAGAKDGVWDRDAEERWARGWERYFADGIAPLKKLQPIFDKIAKWMMDVYKNIQGSAIDVEITQPVRDIFDRLASRLEQTLPPEMLGKVGSEQDTAQTPPVEPPVSENAPTPEPEPEEKTTGVRKEDLNESRVRHGLSPLSPNRMGTNQQAMDEAFARLAENPRASLTLLARVQAESLRKDGQGKRMEIQALNPVEIALVAIERTKRQITEAKAHQKWEALRESGDPSAVEAAWAAVMEAEEAVDDVGVVIDFASSAAGSNLQALKLHLREDFSLGGLRRKFRKYANGGKALSPEQTAKLADYAERLSQLEARLQAYAEAEAASKDGNEELAKKIVEQQALIEQLQKEVEVAARNGLAKTDNAARRRRLMHAKLDPPAEAARARLREKGFGQGPTLLMQDADVLYQDADPTGDLAAILAARMVEEDLDLADATVEMIREFGEGIADHVEQAYGMAKQLLADTRTGVEGEGHQSAEAILASLGQDIELTKQDVWDLARAHVIAGKRGSDVLDAVTDDLQPLYEGLTRDDVATLFTDYGKVSYPDPGEIPQTLNRLRLLERAALKLIDTAKTLAALSRGAAEVVGLMPKRTGFQRGVMDESSPEAKKQLAKIRQDEKRVRKEMREIEDKMREEGIEVPDDGRRLKTQLEATKRRMANEIEEIEQALTPPLTPRVRVTRGGVTFDEDATKLRAELERLREDYREAFKTETTEEQKIQTAIKGLDRRIAEVKQMLNDGTPSRAKAEPVTSPEIEERRETLKELNQKRKELRDALDGKKELSPEELAREAASKVAGRWIDKLSKAQSDTITWPKRAEVNPMSDLIAAHIKSPVADFEAQAAALGATPEQAQSLKKLAETERSHIELVKQARVAKAVTPEQRAAIAEKSLDRRIAEEESMLKEGILTRPKNEPITSPALEAKRNRLAELRQRRRDLYEAAHPGETALAQAKAATLKAIARMGEMLRTGDVAARRREQVTPDEHLESLLEVRNALADEVAERRRALPKTPAQERAEVERALRQSEATLAKLEAKLAAGDLSVKTTLPTLAASNPAVQKVRNHIKELNKELARQRRAAKPKKDPMTVRLERYIRDMAKRRELLKERVRTGDTSPLRKKTEPLRQKEAREARYAYEDAKKEFNQMVFQEMLNNMSSREHAIANTKDVLFQFGRMVQTSFDAGNIGRQAFLVALNNPDTVLKNLGKAFKGFSKEYATRIDNEIRDHEFYHLFTEAGLSITSWRPGFKLAQQEEEHRSRLARKIPGIPASERSYVTYLNAVRMSYAEKLYKSMEGRGTMTDAGLKELMNHVNNMTGRGSLGKFETSAGAISDYFFSVKYWSSRVRFLGNLLWRPLDFVTGGAISKMTMKSERLAAQKVISKEYAKSAAGYAIFYGFLYVGRTFLTDDDDEPLYDIGSDPTESDFGKLVFKNGTRVDVGAGVLQNAVFGSRALELIFGEKRGSSGFNTVESLVTRFVRTKVAPSVGVAWDLASGRDFLGDPVYVEKELVGMYIPITFTEVYENLRQLGLVKGTAAGIASFLGFGTSTYGPGTKDVDAIEDLIVGEYSPIKATSNGILFFFDREVQPNRYMLPPEVGFTRKK